MGVPPRKYGPSGGTAAAQDARGVSVTWQRFRAALDLAVNALTSVGIPAVDLSAFGEGLRAAASALDDALFPRGVTQLSGRLVEGLLAAAVAEADEDLPAPGTPYEQFSDPQVLLAAAYRLADLADVLLTAPEHPTPGEVTVALRAARTVLKDLD